MPPLTRHQRMKIREKLRNDVVELEYYRRCRDTLNKEFVVTCSEYNIHNALQKSYDCSIFALILRIQKYEKILGDFG